MMKRYFVLLSAIILLMFLITSPGFTTLCKWSETASDSDWNYSLNWEGGITPVSSSDDVVISTTSTGNYPDLNSPTTIGNLIIDGNGAMLKVSADPFTVARNISLINGGELRHNIMGDIICGGDWDDSGGIFQPSSGTVIMNGISATIFQSSSNGFYNLGINPPSTGVCTVSNELSVQGDLFIGAKGELWLENIATNNHDVQGTIAVDGKLTFQDTNLWTYGNVNIYTGGTLDIGQGGCLYLSSGVVVSQGGSFNAYRVDISTSSGIHYSIQIDGSLYWDDVILRGCLETYISPSATISKIREVDFLNSDDSSTTAHLFIDRTGNSNESFSFELINFDNTKGYNCHLKGDNTINVTFINSGGIYTGDMYEWEDGGAVINWTTESYTIIVDKQGAGDYTSIQAGINAANPGDVVMVREGVYNENITMKNAVDLIGDGPDVTIIDGGGSGSVVVVADAVIEGFAIINGGGSNKSLYKVGGGIYCEGTSPFIKNCVIANNIIQHDDNAYGGGIYIYSGNPQIINCTIVDNHIHSPFNSYGGGIYSNSSFVLINTIVAFNLADAPDTHVGGIFTTNVGLSNGYNLIFDNQPVETSGYSQSTTDMFIDPLFVDGPNRDFHLLVNSPCIDAGDPALQDEDGSRSDIGALPFITGTTPALESINGTVTKIDGTPITGVIITARQNGSVIASGASETDGSFITEDLPAGWYSIEASWSVNDITSSVEQLTHTGSIYLHFTLAIDCELAVIEGDVDGVDTSATSSCSSRLRSKSLSPKAHLAFVELGKNENVIVRVAVDTSGHYQIPNLLPGTYTARAYNGRIYSKSKIIKIAEGQRLSIDFSFPLDLKESSVYNYPNPACEGYTVIRYSCSNPNHRAKIRIFTISGELVREIKDSETDRSQAPVYEYRWDLENDRGRGVSSGIYLYILELEEKSSGETEQVTKKLAIVR